MATTVLPYIPTFITVHLGAPSSNADNVTVRFSDYVKNVASSEVYPGTRTPCGPTSSRSRPLP